MKPRVLRRFSWLRDCPIKIEKITGSPRDRREKYLDGRRSEDRREGPENCWDSAR